MLKNYIVSHKEFEEFESNFSSTIWVGEIGLKNPNNDRGEGSISCRNSEFAELTALHKVWKSTDDNNSSCGISHYRRQLLLKNIPKVHSVINESKYTSTCLISREKVSEMGLMSVNKAEFNEISSSQLILPMQERMKISVKSQFIKNHSQNQWDLMNAALFSLGENKIANWLNEAENYFIRWGNIFLAKKSVLNEYCEWLFGVLKEVENIENRFHIKDRSRMYAFMAERLFSAYVEMHSKRNNCLRIMHKPTLLIDYQNKDFWFNLTKISKSDKFLIWGTGSFAEKFYNGMKLLSFDENILGFVSSVSKEKGFGGLRTYSKDDLINKSIKESFVFVVVLSTVSRNEIEKDLVCCGFEKGISYFLIEGF